MTTKEEKRHLKYSDYFATVTLIGIIIIVVTIFSSTVYIKSISKQVVKNQQRIECILSDLSDKNPKIASKKVDNNENYSDFIQNYYTVQANWLNTWLTALAIIMAVLGIMIPICFVKFLENKEKEMDHIIQEAKEQKEESKMNLDIMKRQLDEVDTKSKQMTKDLIEVKDYVATVKAETLYVDAVNKVNDKDYDSAIELLYKVKSVKDSDKIHYLLGECFRQKNKLRKAIEEYSKAIELNKNEVKYYCKNTSCLSRIGEHKKALSNINSAIKLDSNNQKLQLDKAVANVLADKDYFKQSAQATVDKLYEKYKNNAFVLNTMGFLLIKIDNLKQAEELLLNSISKDKHPYYQFYNLTKIYIRTGRYTKAKSMLRQYLIEDSKRENRGIFDDDYYEWQEILLGAEQRIETRDLLEVLKDIRVRKRSGDDE